MLEENNDIVQLRSQNLQQKQENDQLRSQAEEDLGNLMKTTSNLLISRSTGSSKQGNVDPNGRESESKHDNIDSPGREKHAKNYSIRFISRIQS